MRYAHTFELSFKGYEISVRGYYTQGEDDTRDTPGTPSTFEIDTVVLMHNEENLPLPTDIDHKELSEYILENKFDL